MQIVLNKEEEYLEIVTSWAREATEKIAVNLLREGMTVESIVRVTELTLERVQELQAQLLTEQAAVKKFGM